MTSIVSMKAPYCLTFIEDPTRGILNPHGVDPLFKGKKRKPDGTGRPISPIPLKK